MKKFLSILILTIFSSSLIYAEGDSCSYTGEINKCKKANWFFGSPWSLNPKKIKEFQCINVDSKNMDKMVYQIVLDKKFQEIDEKVEWYIRALDWDKKKVWGSEEELLDLINDVIKKFKIWGVFWRQYMDVCSSTSENSALRETAACLTNDDSTVSAWLKEMIVDKNPIDEDDSPCVFLVKTKLEIYKDASFNILKVNRGQIRRDNRAKWKKVHREKYDLLLQILNVCVRYLDSMAKKWPSKTKNPKQS